MSKYSSLLFKPEEYHEVGPFRFPIYHDLVPGEARGIDAYSRQQSKVTFKSIKLAQRIAKDKDISTKEAIDLLGKVGDADNEFVYEYAQELDELQSEGASAVEQRIAFVTLFMRYRGEAKIDGKNWQQLRDWTEQDTEDMPGGLLDRIFDVVLWERDGWPKDGAGKEPEPEFSPPPKKS